MKAELDVGVSQVIADHSLYEYCEARVSCNHSLFISCLQGHPVVRDLVGGGWAGEQLQHLFTDPDVLYPIKQDANSIFLFD